MSRRHMNMYLTCDCRPPVLARVFFVLISIPLVLLAVTGFQGPTITEAFSHSFMILTAFPHMGVVLFYLLVLSLCMRKYMSPMIYVWIKICRGQPSTVEERNRAMRRMNSMDRVVTILYTVGFVLGRMGELRVLAILNPLEAPIIIFLGTAQSVAVGLFTAVLINLSLSNILFPVRRAILLEGAGIPLKKYSFIKKVFVAMFSLLFFIFTQMASTSIELLQTGGQLSKMPDLMEMLEDADDAHEFHDNDGPPPVPDGNFQAMAEQFRRQLGLDLSPNRVFNNEIIRNSFSVLFLRVIFCFLLAMYLLALLKKELRNPLQTVETKLSMLTSSGQEDAELIDIVSNDEFTGIFRSINELIAQKSEQVESSTNRLEKIIEYAADPIVSFNPEGDILIFNPAAERFFGISRDEMSGKCLTDLFSPDEIEYCGCGQDTLAFINFLIDNTDGLRRFSGKGKAGPVHFEANVSGITTSAGTVYTAILRDISAHIELEDNLKRAKAAAENANRLKSEFLANMSHELRTPLNAVLGFTQLLLGDDALSSDQREKIRIISRSGEHLLGLINDILDISKIESGKTELNDTPCNLPEFLKDIYEMFSVRCEKKGLNFELELLDDLPEYVEVDVGKLRQILINLIGNSVKFTREGGIAILAGLEGDKLRFAVTDTGCGIEGADLERILEPFVQSTAGENEGGTGLGLAISSRYIKMMGGELSIKSELGKGSTFSFTVSFRRSERAPQEGLSAGSGLFVVKGESPRVLIVDDKALNRDILRQMLEKSGFTVAEAADGREAVEKNRADSPDIIFMDIRMPVMDGYEAVAAIRSGQGDGKVPVIFALTASAFIHDEQKIMSSGFDGYLAKPFKISSLYALIESKTGLSFSGLGTDAAAGEGSPEVDFAAASSAFTEDLRAALRDALDINDFSAVKTALDGIPAGSPGANAAEALRRAAARFDENESRRILDEISRARS